MKAKNSVKLLTVLISLLLVNCKNPIDDFKLSFKEPISKSTIRIQFSLPENGNLPNDLKFHVLGKDADKIVTNLNTKNFKISKEGLLVLAVGPEFTPNLNSPIEITLVAESKDYLKIIKEIRLVDSQNLNYYFVFIKRNETGNISANQLEFNLEKSRLVDIHSFNGSENLILRFASKTKFFNNQNLILSGDYDLSIVHYNSKNAKSYLPSGGVAQNPVDKNNITLPNPFDFLQVAGLIYLEMSTKKHQIIKRFDSPLSVSLSINPTIINPISGKNIKEGDVIPLISYDSDSNIWKVEGNVVIAKNTQSGVLEASFNITYPAYWMIGWTRNICRIGPSFSIKSSFYEVDILYYAQLVDIK